MPFIHRRSDHPTGPRRPNQAAARAASDPLPALSSPPARSTVRPPAPAPRRPRGRLRRSLPLTGRRRDPGAHLNEVDGELRVAQGQDLGCPLHEPPHRDVGTLTEEDGGEEVESVDAGCPPGRPGRSDSSATPSLDGSPQVPLAVRLPNGRPDDRALGRQRLAPPRSPPPQQHRRALDVGEEHRHRAGGPPRCHGTHTEWSWASTTNRGSSSWIRATQAPRGSGNGGGWPSRWARSASTSAAYAVVVSWL